MVIRKSKFCGFDRLFSGRTAQAAHALTPKAQTPLGYSKHLAIYGTTQWAKQGKYRCRDCQMTHPRCQAGRLLGVFFHMLHCFYAVQVGPQCIQCFLCPVGAGSGLIQRYLHIQVGNHHTELPHGTVCTVNTFRLAQPYLEPVPQKSYRSLQGCR